jgi:Zinc carboxypeptidase
MLMILIIYFLFQLYLTFHSYGQYILYPWGHAAIDADDVNDLHSLGLTAAEAMRSISGRAYSVGSAAKMLYPAAGMNKLF